ncbi:MAG: DNA polymerase III subunit delta' [Chloroflexi bacterium]|nr:DNA polymerase III subunit delta' [Chloroflexota bacterium]
MNDWDIVGHEWAVELLSRDLAGGRLRHAYLFAGPPGIGKRTLALKFAQVINCLSPSPLPPVPAGEAAGVRACGECRPCTLIAKGSHPDVPIVHSGVPSSTTSSRRPSTATRNSPGEGRSIKIDQVRDLERQVSLAPYEATYRVPILLRFHEATTGAQNALLKTLEEPPPQVVILLTADSPDLLLPTIVSRCDVLNLRPTSIAKAKEALAQRRGVAGERAELLAHLSGGRLGWAVRMSEDEERLAQRNERLDKLLGLIAAPRRARMAYAEALAKRPREEVYELLDLWLTWWRDVLLASSHAGAPFANADRIEIIRGLADRIDPERARAAIEAIRKTGEAIDRNANLRLALEVLALDLPALK